ncbi:unnamed protein product [Plutella xylostella]|uniref:(diamondback moth) hypothetical protein n=1 Tax=Plutella xylostella TaxID=51655 RepID=A0A8S4E474_PLUXY|nr:unnamed protein product [Plutella xylostella]
MKFSTGSSSSSLASDSLSRKSTLCIYTEIDAPAPPPPCERRKVSDSSAKRWNELVTVTHEHLGPGIAADTVRRPGHPLGVQCGPPGVPVLGTQYGWPLRKDNLPIAWRCRGHLLGRGQERLVRYHHACGMINWFTINGMQVNIDKTNLLSFSLHRSAADLPAVIVQDTAVPYDTCAKFVGFHFDTGLQWHYHIDSVCAKLNGAFYAISRLVPTLSRENLLKAYYGYFQSALTYGIELWGLAADRDRPFLLQKRMVRRMMRAAPDEPARALFLQLGVLTAPCLYVLEVAKYVRQNLAHFTPLSTTARLQNRRKNDLTLNTARLAKTEKTRLWDEPICRQVQENLLETATSPADRARLMASAEPESGHWLRALPSASVGTLLDRNTFNLSVCLRLGCKTNEPHRCRCGDPVDQLGHHGLSCQRSAGRLPRHAALNDVIRRAFASAGIPAILEPTGLARDDGKRPDGMTVMPWKYGKCLVWDATCTDTVAPSHIQGSAAAAGTAAAAAENLKRRKYNGLSDSYIFVPFGVETLGPWGPEARRLVKELSSRLVEVSRDQRAGSYLSQRISLAIQRGNAASLLGTIPGDGSELKEIFYL